jgi:hypothetical protein
MSPIEFLYVLEMVLAALAPVVAAVCIAQAFGGRWQALCRRLLPMGAAGGCTLGGLWWVTLPAQSETIWAFGAAIFCTGFSGAICIALAWLALRKMFFNTRV